MSETETNKLKVLCLHGYRQNADSFKSKLGSFRKQLSKYVDFVFISAPHNVDTSLEKNIENGNQMQQKSWWFNHDNGTFKGTNKNGPAFGFEESIKLIEKTWKDQGPFNGILGFSQGACLVGLLCSLSERGKSIVKPQFAILAAAFKSGSLVHLNYYNENITIPSLHIYGNSDDIIPNDMSKELSSIFLKPKILTHEGGHYFPATTQQKQFYKEYFQDQLQSYLEALELEKANDSNTYDTI